MGEGLYIGDDPTPELSPAAKELSDDVLEWRTNPDMGGKLKAAGRLVDAFLDLGEITPNLVVELGFTTREPRAPYNWYIDFPSGAYIGVTFRVSPPRVFIGQGNMHAERWIKTAGDLRLLVWQHARNAYED